MSAGRRCTATSSGTELRIEDRWAAVRREDARRLRDDDRPTTAAAASRTATRSAGSRALAGDGREDRWSELTEDVARPRTRDRDRDRDRDYDRRYR